MIGPTGAVRVMLATRPLDARMGMDSPARLVSDQLDRLLADGFLDAYEHAAAVAHGALRRRCERSGGPFRSWRDPSGMSDEAWQDVKRGHARRIWAAGAHRFVLGRLCLDDDAPLSSEVERVRAALGRVLLHHPPSTVVHE